MNRPLLRFTVCDSRGSLLAKGTAAECAKALGMTEKYFRYVVSASRDGKYKGYVIEDITDYGHQETDEWEQSRNADAIRNWNEFVTPLRKKYGIPVYRAKKEG